MAMKRKGATAWKRCTPQQRRFIQALFDFPGIPRIQAVWRSGYKGTDTTAKMAAYRWSRHPDVLQAIKDYAEKEFEGQIPEAIGAIKTTISNPKAREQFKASIAVLEATGVVNKATQHVQHDINISISDMRDAVRGLLSRPAFKTLVPEIETIQEVKLIESVDSES